MRLVQAPAPESPAWWTTAALLISLLAAPAPGTPGAQPTSSHPLDGVEPPDTGDVGREFRRLTPADLVTVTQVDRLRMSDDGEKLLVVTSGRADPDSAVHRVVSTVEVSSGERTPLTLPEAERDPAWRPRSHQISYIAPRDGTPQVWLRNEMGDPVALTNHPRGVRSYRWSPNGEKLAFTAPEPRPEAGREKPRQGPRGIEVDPAWFQVKHLLRGRLSLPEGPVATQLWATAVGSDRSSKVSRQLSVIDYAWGPRSTRLAVTAREEPRGRRRRVRRSDLFIASLDSDTLRAVLQGRPGVPFRGGGSLPFGAVSYGQPVWGPDGRRLAFLRSETDSSSTVHSLGLLDLQTDGVRHLLDNRGPWLASSRIEWIEPDRLHVAATVKSRRGLFAISSRTGERSELIRSSVDRSHFTFSRDGGTVAWRQEAVDHPPEVYASSGGEARRLTRLNQDLAADPLPEIRSEVWRSDDGTEVEGWLVLPSGYRPDRTYPLLVTVHGGPGFPVANTFPPYPQWPFPTTLLTQRGYAVLFPNYRGTATYGESFRNPTAPDREPVADILTGIDHLIDEGVADSSRVGIMGHSHGAWLGPMVVAARPQQFRAASFAEGWGDQFSLYGQMPGWLNQRTHEPAFGGTPYERPERYLEMSAVLREGVRSTPTLLEAGEKSAAVQWMEYATALWREGTPHEFIIYPGAGHNLQKPELKMDAMRRNLDWWAKWIEPGPAPSRYSHTFAELSRRGEPAFHPERGCESFRSPMQSATARSSRRAAMAENSPSSWTSRPRRSTVRSDRACVLRMSNTTWLISGANHKTRFFSPKR